MTGLGIAFKEWAVVCQALAEGRQAITLRKGGIAESQGVFRVEHSRFWLYPTFVHQMDEGIVDTARPYLDKVRGEKPPAGVVRLTHFAEVVGVRHLDDLEAALALSPLHIWSRATVEARFAYRTPGLFVLALRVYRAGAVHEIAETPEYAGCKSWVALSHPLTTADAVPVVDDEAFATLIAGV